ACAGALARAVDRLRNTPVEHPARAELPRRYARRVERAEGRLVPVLDRRRLRGAGETARARARDRALLPRRYADARRHLPRPAGGERAPFRHRPVAVPDVDANRRRLLRAARLRASRACTTTRRRMNGVI